MPEHATKSGSYVPPAQLGSGTPDGTKFLRDDNSWQPVGGGGPHAGTHVTGGGDTIANAVGGGASGLMSGADKTKLDGIADGAEVNVNADWNAGGGDSQILNKPTILGFNDAEGDPAPVAAVAADGTSGNAARRDHVHAGALLTSAFSGLAKISVGTATPGSPSVGDLWVDTN